MYFDGQFDDTRLLINLARTAADQGAVLLNYAKVTGLLYDDEKFVAGVKITDVETDTTYDIPAKCVINATGAFSDAVRKIDDADTLPMIAPSQGVHLVLDRSFLPGESAIMVPRTSDGRVMFAIPWHGHTLLGTTDTPIKTASLEPVALSDEIRFILETASQYLSRPPMAEDVLSVFTGIRPLVKASDASNTAALSRDHTIQISKSGPAHDLRRQVDDLPPDGARCGRPRDDARQARRAAVHDAGVESARVRFACRSVWRSEVLRL